MKKILVFLLSLLAVLVVLCSENKSPTQSVPSASTDQECQTCKSLITLNRPVSASELSEIVNTNGIKVKEFTFKDGEMSGGYVLKNGESIDNAVQRFASKHLEFLNQANEVIAENLKKEEDQVAINGYTTLSKQIKSSLNNKNPMIDKIIVDSYSEDAAKDLGKLEKCDEQVALPKKTLNQSLYHESWAPYYGESKVTRQMTFQFFYFNNISYYNGNNNVTYEHETQVYDEDYADFDGYWASNLPHAYHDTQFGDDLDNFTVGSSSANYLQAYTMYYTHMSLSEGSAQTATVRIKGQVGHRIPSFYYSTWCIFPVATSNSFLTILYIMKNKKIFIVFGIIFAYLFTGLVIYFIGGEVRGISFYEKITSAITVMIGWPIFLVVRFFN